jgi:hypothetical protein
VADVVLLLCCVLVLVLFFYSDEPRYWYWEVTVIVKKMLLTGACNIITPGSSSQIAIALLIVQVNLLLVLKLGPFVDAADDWLAFLTSFQMLLTLLGGLLIMTDANNTYPSETMGIILVCVNVWGFFALIVSLIALNPKCRKILNGKNNSNNNKVVPVESALSVTEMNAVKSWEAPAPRPSVVGGRPPPPSSPSTYK